jgi:hypothetical protein
MSAANAFLRDFIQMRKSLVPSGVAGDTKLVTSALPNGKKSKKKTTAPELGDDGKMTVAKIIEDKPKNRDVIQFLQDRCNELTIAKMV